MKKWLAIILAFFMTSFAWFPAHFTYAKESNPNPLAAQAKSAILMEQSTGKVLYSKNANQSLPPASMTKMMTLLLIFKALDAGDIHMTDKVTVSDHAASMGGSQIYLEPGEIMTVQDMLKSIIIGSANDASMAMAEYVAGSDQAFVNKMNQEAKKLHLTHTHFKNPTGLPEKGHYSSAHDMAVIAKNLLKYPNVLKYSSLYEAYVRENTAKKFWLVNTNKMIRTYQGVDGLKTGFTQDAKFCLTATAHKNGMRVIAVIMGAPTSKERNAEVAGLLNYAYSNYKVYTLENSHTILGNVQLMKSAKRRVNVEITAPATVILKKGQQLNGYTASLQVKSNQKAPLKKGTPVGSYIIKHNDQVVRKIPVVLSESAPAASWWDYIRQSTDRLFRMT